MQGGCSHGPDFPNAVQSRDRQKNHLPQTGERFVSNRNVKRSRPSKATVLRQSGTTREHTRALKGGNKIPIASCATSRTALSPISDLQWLNRCLSYGYTSLNSSEVTAAKRNSPAAVSLVFPRICQQRTLLGSIFTAGQQLLEHLPAPSRPWLPSTAFD